MLLQQLESRLDVVLLRAGLATSIRQARQFVRHGYLQVDGVRTNIPSYRLRPGNEVRFDENHRELPVVRNCFERMKGRAVPAHLVVEDGRAVRYTRMPEREEIPVDVNVPFIVEFYAQRV